MTIDTSNTESVSSIPGNTIKWARRLADYRGLGRGALSYELLNSMHRYDILACADGDSFRVVVSAQATQVYALGLYDWRACMKNADEVYTVPAGRLSAWPGFRTRTSAGKVSGRAILWPSQKETEMQPQFENIVQTETGVRNALRTEYKGTKVEVVTGYDINGDDCPFHVYVTPLGGRKEPLFDKPTKFRCSSMDAAFEQGKAMAAQWHDRKVEGGFQKEVRTGQTLY